MSHIDPTITCVTDNEKAVISKYGFEVRDEFGAYVLIDKVVVKDRGPKAGRYIAKWEAGKEHAALETLLKGAVAYRKEKYPETDGNVPDAKPNGKASGKTAKKAKAEKKAKEPKAPKERKDNRYLRATKIIVDKTTINAEDLAKAASMSKSTASHCLEAWKGVTAVLLEKKWLKLPKSDNGK